MNELSGKRFFKNGVEDRWAYRFPAVETWLETLRDELAAPDLWGELFSGKSLAIRSALTPIAARFTEDQVRQLSGELHRIEGRIVELHQLTAAQKEAMHDGFEEIKAGIALARRIGLVTQQDCCLT